jgi:hypothetical protein
MSAPHFGQQFFSIAIKGGARVKPEKAQQSFSDQWRRIAAFFWEEKLVAPLIATPNVDKAIEDK